MLRVCSRARLASLALLLLPLAGGATLAHGQEPSTDPRPAPPRAEGEGPFARLVIRNATLYDGSGDAPIQGDIAISGDTIAAMGEIAEKGKTEVEAKGMAVSPGCVNMLS